jgi:hypothetical protein
VERRIVPVAKSWTMKIIARAIVQEITRNVSKIGGHVNFKINRLYLIVDTFGTVYILCILSARYSMCGEL